SKSTNTFDDLFKLVDVLVAVPGEFSHAGFTVIETELFHIFVAAGLYEPSGKLDPVCLALRSDSVPQGCNHAFSLLRYTLADKINIEAELIAVAGKKLGPAADGVGYLGRAV